MNTIVSKTIKNFLIVIVVIILIVVAIPNSNAQFGMVDMPTKYESYDVSISNYYNDNYVNNFNINQSNYGTVPSSSYKH